MKNLNLKGHFSAQCFDKNGDLKWEDDFPNGIVDEGLHGLLDDYFKDNTAGPSAWYIGLIDNSPAPTLDAGDTAAEIGGTNGWDEYELYSGSNRLAWSPDAASTRAISNSTTADFTMTNGSTEVIYGIFIAEAQVRGATTGVLWSTAAFSSTASVETSDVLKITYTITG
ncbi:MAG: hypothetical protein GY906_04685 [bacterium]|nr:hypothetical protein [bacterium]